LTGFEILLTSANGAFLAFLKPFCKAGCANEYFAVLALDWEVGKSRANAASYGRINVLILKLVDTCVVKSNRIYVVADFILNALEFLWIDVEHDISLYHLLT
jgi:hypothetical protein